MPRQEINYDQVAQAAESIKLKGQSPSLTNVSEALGMATVTPDLSTLLMQWYSGQPDFQRSNISPLSDNIKIKKKNILQKNIELEKSLSLLRATLECTADGIMMVNGEGQVVDWNQKFVEMWRIPSHMLESGTEKIGFEYILSQVSDPQKIIKDVEFLYSNPEWQGELPPIQFKDGRIFERYSQPQRVGTETVGRVYSFRDITQKLIANDELRIRERAIEAWSHGVAIVDITKSVFPIIYINKACERITGYTEKQLIGKNIEYLHGNKADHVGHRRILLAIKEKREEIIEMECIRQQGDHVWCQISVFPVHDSFGGVKHYVCILNDITQRREMEEQLLQQATHDALTDLPNRVLLLDRVEQAILQARKKNGQMAFLFLDLDRFKMINDTLGHSIGDKLLQAVANRLLVATDDFDTIARVGGDEFVILLPDIRDEQQGEKMAASLLRLVERPFQIGQHNLKITGSVGISYYPKDGLDYESLMKNADLSMYHAKDNGRNTYRRFEQEMNNRVINRMQLENALRDSIKDHEFYLVYQPLMSLKTGKLSGFEALIRWNSRTLGAVSPVDFIGMAEETGLIVDIGQWVLEEACHQLKRWHAQGFKDLTIAVNISGREFRQGKKLPQMVAAILKRTGLQARYLELELTESLLIEDIHHTVELMDMLKEMGVSLVIDDFGTGYSSLSYLKQFPVDKLKIDRSFIAELVSKESEGALTKAIIQLGHSLNLQVLAEGVETELQREFIEASGCDFAQGYLFKPPKVPDELETFIVENTDIQE